MRYGNDPRWITAKWAGVDFRGVPFNRGAEVLYYPRTKRIYTGAEAEKLWAEFQAAAADEDVYNGQSW